jgi:hypothetical protein
LLDTELLSPGFGMKGRLDDTTSQAAVKLWHEQDSPPQRVHTPLERERADRVLDAEEVFSKNVTHIALLLIHMPDLKPNVGIGKRTWGIAQDAIEAA